MSPHGPYCDEQHTVRQRCNDARRLNEQVKAERTSVAQAQGAAHTKWCDERHPIAEECNVRAIDGATAADIALRLSRDGILPSADAVVEAIRSEARGAGTGQPRGEAIPDTEPPNVMIPALPADALTVAAPLDRAATANQELSRIPSSNVVVACRGLIRLLIVVQYPLSMMFVHVPLLFTAVLEERPPTAHDEMRPLRWVGYASFGSPWQSLLSVPGIFFTLWFIIVVAFWSAIHAPLVLIELSTSRLWHSLPFTRPFMLVLGTPASALDGAIYSGFERLWAPSQQSFLPAYRTWPDSWPSHKLQGFSLWDELDLLAGAMSGYRTAKRSYAPGIPVGMRIACVKCGGELTLRERVLGLNTHESCPAL